MNRALTMLAFASLLGAAPMLSAGCASAQIAQAVRDPNFQGTIRRLVVVVRHVLPSEQVLPAVMQAEFAKRKVACLAFVASEGKEMETEIEARKTELDAFAPDAWMLIHPSDRLVNQYGVIQQTHYQVSVATSLGRDERWIWRADVVDSGDSAQERLALMAVRIADYMTAERLMAGP